MLTSPISGGVWLGLTDGILPTAVALEWVVLPGCGAVVMFSGTARDCSAGRPGVDLLEYEAYESQVIPRFKAIASEMRRRWDGVGRIALLHRVGAVRVSEAAVIVAVSAPHRAEAFSAARFGIDALKSTVPIWKRERWHGGRSWGLEPQHLLDVSDVPDPDAPCTPDATDTIPPCTPHSPGKTATEALA